MSRPEPAPGASTSASLRAWWTRARGVLGAVVRIVLRWALRLGLPLGGAAVALQAFPCHATVQGIPFTVQGTLFNRPGLSADTTLGSWEFPSVDRLPIGVHVAPVDVDVLALVRAANGDTADFVRHLQADFTAQLPRIVTWLATEAVIGLAAGLAVAAAVNMAVRYLTGRPRRARELHHRAVQLGAAVLAVAGIAGVGALTYNPHWTRQSRLTGTLAAGQLFPDQLSSYYSQQSKAFDVLGSVIGIQAALQNRIDENRTPPTALRIMFISDMHLAPNYPLVAQYVQNYGVDLIIDTGDESEFGTRLELTPSYLDSLAAITRNTPMLWVAGNHDSPDVVATMRSVPGVTVLGGKTANGDGITVTAEAVDAFGLTVAGVPDPRVYGGDGAYGADDGSTTAVLERAAVDRAVKSLQKGSPDAGTAASASASPTSFDVFATHEPVAAEELRKQLPGRIRETVAGHVHAQNAPDKLQSDAGIDLVEGSTGAGGLDNIVRGDGRPPIEFSIESVGVDCQFTRIVRFQIRTPDAAPATATDAAAYGDDVTASTIYFRPQAVTAGRTCGPGQGISAVAPL